MNAKSLSWFSSILLIVFFLNYDGAEATSRLSSAPYLSGDTFRASCDYILDETGCTLIPGKVQHGQTIFVKTDYLDLFFRKFHPQIQNAYILITHNSDYGVPGSFARYLDDDKLIGWFGQNVENYTHKKLHPIPIGLANRTWPHGNVTTLDSVVQKLGSYSKNIFLYMNFVANNYPNERNRVYELFADKAYCTKAPVKDFSAYLEDVAQSKFVLSPRGNGLDCHRTWEALYLGAIPILRKSSLDPMFTDLPVLLVDNWEEIDQKYLEEKYAKMQAIPYKKEKLYIDYWMAYIHSFR